MTLGPQQKRMPFEFCEEEGIYIATFPPEPLVSLRYETDEDRFVAKTEGATYTRPGDLSEPWEKAI